MEVTHGHTSSYILTDRGLTSIEHAPLTRLCVNMANTNLANDDVVVSKVQFVFF